MPEAPCNEPPYRIVRLANGTRSIHAAAERETFHPVIGPVAEAEALYVRQLKLRERVAGHVGEFVLWDVGLGAAANVLTALRATRDLDVTLRILSFDRTVEALRFALGHAAELGFIEGYEEAIQSLLKVGCARFSDGRQLVVWELHLGDFPSLLRAAPASALPAPHAILFDAFSPAKNPAMWTAPLFSALFQRLVAARACTMATYSRSTMLRVTLLRAGFYVGAGHATGEKDETTIASNDLTLLEEPLPRSWLERVRRSKSAEPMWEPVYREAAVAPETWEALRGHRQFD